MNLFYFIVQQAVIFTTPLLVVSLAAMFSERSGVINIGVEGIMIVGAFVGTLFLHFYGKDPNANMALGLLIAILLSALAGTLYSVFHAFASINMYADQTISGTALNMFAPAFCIYIARSLVGIQQVSFPGAYMISKVPLLGDIPIIGPALFQNAYITTYLGILVLVVSVVVLYHTPFGLRLRSAGEHPQATDAAGVSVEKIRWAGVLISGLLAGFGGFAYILPVSTEFNATVSGYGFLAIAVLIFGQWKPKYIALAAIFFGVLKTISATYSSVGFLANLGIPQSVYQALPYIVTIIVLAMTSRKSAAPAAEGIPFDKGER